MYITKYKISLIQQTILISNCLFSAILILTLWQLFIDKLSIDSASIFLYFFILLFILLPALILHIQYYNINKDSVLTIDGNTQMITYSTTGNIYTNSFHNIEKIEIHLSYGKGTGFYSFSEYRYCKFLFNDGKQITVTCLMINRIETIFQEIFSKTLFDKKYSFFTNIPST